MDKLDPHGIYTDLPLDATKRDIRLVRLYAGEDGEVPKCTLFQVSLDDNPAYEALSYAWETQHGHSTIELQGKKFTVTTNLFEGLRRLRNRRTKPHSTFRRLRNHEISFSDALLRRRKDDTVGDTIFWIDALCINQDSIPERNEQVRMMSDIYSRARRTVIWLGDGGDAVIGLFNFMRWLVTHIKPDDRPSYHVSRLNQYSNTQSGRDRLLDAIEDVLTRSWFTRIWVIQEFCLSQGEPLVCCGKATLPWQSFLLASESFKLAHQQLREGPLYSNYYMLNAIRGSSKRVVNLSYLVSNTSVFDATDKRDKIFALRGVLEEADRSLVIVDYNKSSSDVYRDTTRAIISKEGNLDIVLRAQYINLGPSSLPSWTPDFGNLVAIGSSSELVLLTDDPPYRTSSSVRTRASFPQPGILEASGISFDSVTRKTDVMKVGFSMEVSESTTNWIEIFRLFSEAGPCGRCAEAGKDSHVSEYRPCLSLQKTNARFNAVWRTLIADRAMQTYLHDMCEDVRLARMLYTGMHPAPEHYQALFSLRFENEFATELIDLPRLSSQDKKKWKKFRDHLPAFQSRLAMVLHNRVAFSTKHGYIGIGPGNTQEGDLIVTLDGAVVPYVLRPQGERYTLIGHCYVHGIMGGELYDHYDRYSEVAGGFARKRLFQIV